MTDPHIADYYEVLQVSSRADQQTIEGVFRHLAKRYHPDNSETGDAEHFSALVEAYRVLSDPEKRAQYDVSYDRVREHRWQIFGQETVLNEVAADSRVRIAILSILYAARRNSARDPGVGPVEIERLLACPDPVLQFHFWYLRENGWIERLTSGLLAITASGVDRLYDLGGPARQGQHLLVRGDGAGSETELVRAE